jgi:hypothetical protein
MGQFPHLHKNICKLLLLLEQNIGCSNQIASHVDVTKQIQVGKGQIRMAQVPLKTHTDIVEKHIASSET